MGGLHSGLVNKCVLPYNGLSTFVYKVESKIFNLMGLWIFKPKQRNSDPMKLSSKTWWRAKHILKHSRCLRTYKQPRYNFLLRETETREGQADLRRQLSPRVPVMTVSQVWRDTKLNQEMKKHSFPPKDFGKDIEIYY